MQYEFFVYIMTNFNHTVLYTGVTNDIFRRVLEHREGKGSRFTTKYRVNKLVYVECVDDVHVALEREKRLKGGSRRKKMDLINSLNPDWSDLYDTL